jgi:cell division septal protein FtsQ
VLAVLGVVFSLTVLFKVTEIKVEGDLKIYSEADILAASGITAGGNLFRLDTGASEKAVWSSLAYIDAVKVRRSLPGTVVIAVSEIEHLFAVEWNGQYLVISKNLKILEITSAPADYLPIIRGMPAQDPVKGDVMTPVNGESASFFASLVKSLNDYGMLAGVSAFDLSDKLNYTLTYEDRMEVMIGTANNLDYKINMLSRVVLDRLDPGDEGFLDISDAGKVTFKPKASQYSTGIQPPDGLDEPVDGAEEEIPAGEGADPPEGRENPETPETDGPDMNVAAAVALNGKLRLKIAL